MEEQISTSITPVLVRHVNEDALVTICFQSKALLETEILLIFSLGNEIFCSNPMKKQKDSFIYIQALT